MIDSRYDDLIFGFIEFIFSVGERLINVCVSCLIIYCISYILMRYIIFGNNKAQFAEFAESIRSGFKDAAGAFKDAMPAVKEMAKSWADATIARLRK